MTGRAPAVYAPRVKMKFSFTMVGTLLGLLGWAGCSLGKLDAPRPVAPDGGDAQRLALLLDYVGGDYGRAVQGGAILSQAEYDEQLRFVADASALTVSLVGPAAEAQDPLLEELEALATLVKERADPETVGAACHAARDAVVSRFGLRTMPTSRPQLARAEALYGQSCAVCHGFDGRAQTERAKTLEPRPASFRDPSRLNLLSPFRVYSALTFGVPGTGMASFDSFSPAERWDLAFYVFRLGHDGERGLGPVGLTLAELAARSDREILEALRSEHHPSPEAGLVHARRETPFTAPAAAASAERTRELVRAAVAAHAAGRHADADRLAIDAYLQGFEPLEPQLRARDADGTLAIESAFRELRAALSGEDTARVQSRAEILDAGLFEIAESGRAPGMPFVAAALIFFREGIEAALIVAALLAGLRKLGRPDASRYVHLGWLAAVPAGVLTWFVFERVLALGMARRELLEAVVALLAAGVLFSVSFWMISKAESRHWLAYLHRNLETSLSQRNLRLLASLAFLAVYREAAETVLFTQALLFDAGGQHAQVWFGALAGTLAAAGAAWMMNRSVLRLPLGAFFGVSGALLCALAISFAGSGIYGLVKSGFLRPRPIAFPEVAWMGIYPDLTGVLVQLLIVAVIVGAGLATLRRPRTEASR